ncbi:sulfite oxidase heme-binding subunit YedZ [Cellvibrio sp. ARAG 10.3]|uniref:sulfite oxidase heme-binding subunit YedZ n=1 Tax=Cellvibrio sp. ARAG 10.3 TaxID=3451358 RepID=UPI003F454B92
MQQIPTRWRRLTIFLCALIPFAWLVFNTITQQLGADPAKTIVLFTGEWTIYFLFITLSVTPLRRLLKWNWLMPHRRMLGLFALFYGVLHLLSYLIFILGLDFSRLVSETLKRPYITVGFPALLILIVLGITSTQKMMRRLGKNWVKLHRLVYLALILAWIHVLWQVRSSYFEAAVYGAIVTVLLGIRLFWAFNKNKRRAAQ